MLTRYYTGLGCDIAADLKSMINIDPRPNALEFQNKIDFTQVYIREESLT